MTKVEARKRIERSYQRAMDIRDSSSRNGFVYYTANRAYTAAYMKAYKKADFESFKKHTRLYLRRLRGKVRA